MQLRKLPTTLALVTVTFVGACTSPARFDTADQNNAQSGAILGGLLGAMVGIADAGPGDKGQGAIRGAIVGATAGAVVGTQLDRQAEALQASMGNSGVMITNTGESLIVTLPQDILFATDSTALRADLQADLGALARNLQDYPNSTVQVIGHTDNVGSATYNEDLSLRRANAVANVLISRGVSTARISTIGLGENQPVATNLTAEGRAQNRRVEIIILPNA
ncbi:MAG: OmpA family protein [Paracoccaceae bacterium]|jgi:outer membrane protein OmpA-like peptidoglycan-associated protein|nr:OmpA family protein [Paracoccaceae bacterium]MDP7186438.1 OmpA family protein [Paracoccaceae bacterium]